MHTTDELSAADFEYRRDGAPVSRDAVMPPIGVADRLGLVMAEPTDGLGAGHFVLSCVTAFYDRLREQREAFFEYPDYYTFQATDAPADYLELDVWPAHKNVRVEPDPEAVLRAVNDRAVNVLLVPDDAAGDADAVSDVARRSAERRVEACFAYAPDGDLDDADFSVRLPREPAAGWYRGTVETTDAAGAAFEPALESEGHLTQRFRAIELEEALASLTG